MIYGRLPFYAEGEKEITKLIKKEYPKFNRYIQITSYIMIHDIWSIKISVKIR
jgi:hypothetical protein